ncbi:MAG: hypothetical protein R3F17_14240 [Planctomycetota bacterium]
MEVQARPPGQRRGALRARCHAGVHAHLVPDWADWLLTLDQGEEVVEILTSYFGRGGEC